MGAHVSRAHTCVKGASSSRRWEPPAWRGSPMVEAGCQHARWIATGRALVPGRGRSVEGVDTQGEPPPSGGGETARWRYEGRVGRQLSRSLRLVVDSRYRRWAVRVVT